ncbi:protein phosphatase 1 regulatory subunit 14A-like isoform X1 [Dermochelys coriacea]|uniref:protein phosphatase 1 regulatory subunit 14A-like isoform X1 n=1 Tax=Dermochelys coriacea TaxID=27794 RepID=UPI0018E85FA9|nr:protein phosphatase 1 regulatory subunit 14A-like isoform X1 [Dermochelys coriacea]
MAVNRVGRWLRRGSPVCSPGRPRVQPARSPGIQKRQARVMVKYGRRELQRRLDPEKWIDGRLEELYRGREAEMPDEVNIDELLELDADEARAAQLQGILKSCHNNTQAFVQELLLKLRGLQKQQALRRPSPERQERA